MTLNVKRRMLFRAEGKRHTVTSPVQQPCGLLSEATWFIERLNSGESLSCDATSVRFCGYVECQPGGSVVICL